MKNTPYNPDDGTCPKLMVRNARDFQGSAGMAGIGPGHNKRLVLVNLVEDKRPVRNVKP